MELTLTNMIFVGLALVFVIEGLVYALFPDVIRKMMMLAIALPPEKLRVYGLSMAVLGALTLWAVKHLS